MFVVVLVAAYALYAYGPGQTPAGETQGSHPDIEDASKEMARAAWAAEAGHDRRVGEVTSSGLPDPSVDSGGRPLGIEAVVGRPAHRWLYVWPHELFPERIDGYSVVAGPIVKDAKGRGRTMANWLKPVVLRPDDGVCEVSVVFKRDLPMGTAKPWLPRPMPRVCYDTVQFDGIPAGQALSRRPEGDVLYFVFRFDDVVCHITCRAKLQGAEMGTHALAVAKAILGHMREKMRRTP
jgi:hypothetical protein